MWSYCSVSISYKKYIIHTHKVSPMMNRKDSWEVLSLEDIPICPNYCLLWWHLHLMLVVNWISAVLLWMQSQRQRPVFMVIAMLSIASIPSIAMFSICQRPVFMVIAMLSGFILGWDWCRPRLDWVRLVWIWQDCIGMSFTIWAYSSPNWCPSIHLASENFFDQVGQGIQIAFYSFLHTSQHIWLSPMLHSSRFVQRKISFKSW